jgi:hypothetical protein
MKNIFRGVAIVISLFSFQLTIGQSSIVQGLIRDKYGIPLSGASITVDGKNSGTISDLSGHYALKLKPGRHCIAVSYIGYAKQQVNLNTCVQTSVERNFILTEIYRTCKEVVVVSSSYNRHKNSPAKNSYADQNKSAEEKMPVKQFELHILNNLLDY